MIIENVPALIIRDITTIAEMRDVEQLQKDVWGVADREVFPALALVPLTEIGGILLGAFADDRLAGFVFGFPGLEKGRLILHSDMLAVRPEYRSAGLGYRLKLAQRERALAKGIDTITWTFDPLQSLNAYLNFGRLGVIADRYRINYYGETTSFLHQTGTDRLWVTWQLNSQRVMERIADQPTSETSGLAEIPAVIRVGENAEPVSCDERQEPEGSLVIEIPDNINLILNENVELALHWREATRNAFTKAMAAAFFVAEYYLEERGGRKVGIYLLRATRSPV